MSPRGAAGAEEAREGATKGAKRGRTLKRQGKEREGGWGAHRAPQAPASLNQGERGRVIELHDAQKGQVQRGTQTARQQEGLAGVDGVQVERRAHHLLPPHGRAVEHQVACEGIAGDFRAVDIVIGQEQHELLGLILQQQALVQANKELLEEAGPRREVAEGHALWRWG